jgi:tetratricopeptide (TPR) repeat protein
MSDRDPALPTSESPAPRSPRWAALGLAVFAGLLAATTARNTDLFQHLLGGRNLISGGWSFSNTWLFDLVLYSGFQWFQGTGLVVAKVVAIALLSIGLERTARTHDWPIPFLAVGLALLAAAHRLPLQPAIASLLIFTCVQMIVLTRRTGERVPIWRLAIPFAIWANVHDWWMFGLVLLALQELGDRLDGQTTALPRRGWIVLLACCLLSPWLWNGVRGPAILSWVFGESGDTGMVPFQSRLHSPFTATYWEFVRESPAGLAYYALLALGGLSFVLNRSGWKWSRALPVLATAGLSAVEARTIPLFAVVVAPVLARNLDEWVGRDLGRSFGSRAFGMLVALVFCVAAWPGWLQSAPYEPRRLAVEPPADLVSAARAGNRWIGLSSGTSRTLHLSRDSLAVFNYYCPDNRGVIDDRILAALVSDDPASAERMLREQSIERIVVRAGDSAADRHLARLLASRVEWPLVQIDGGVALFCRNEARPIGVDPIDLDRIAYRPTEAEQAPPQQPAVKEDEWWHLLQPPNPARSAARDEARLFLKIVESYAPEAPIRHLSEWEAFQIGGLIGTPNPVDAAIRAQYFRPAIVNEDPFTRADGLARTIFAAQQRFARDRGFAPPGLVYAAIRAARRASAETPEDAGAFHLLGQAYLALPQSTAEAGWGARLPQVARLRNVQASAAFNRAVELQPRLAESHYELGMLYQGAGCFDLAIDHLDSWRALEVRRVKTGADRTRLDQVEPILEKMRAEVEKQRIAFRKESEKISVGDRAANAVRRGLGGTARDLLLKSDISAFGKLGADIQFDFLLRTGRTRDVINWLTPEVQGTIGAFPYRWSRAQAYAARGDYAAARDELAATHGPEGALPSPARVRERIATLLGWAVLDEQPNRLQAPERLLFVMRHSDFLNSMLELDATLTRECETDILVGLLALESGLIDEARAQFQGVLALAPRRGQAGQLNAPSFEIAREALQLIDR